MIQVDCKELSEDEQLALTGEITEAMKGQAISFVKGDKIVFDDLSDRPLDPAVIEAAVKDFVSRRRDHDLYSVDMTGDTIVVHSPDPMAHHSRRTEKLPPNLFMCPFCPFVTPYQELYVVHYRSHGFV